MAANVNEVGITVDSPTASPSENGSAHTSLVSSYQGRHYGTVNKGQWKANGYILHTITPTDTLQGIALRYKVPVCFLSAFTNHLLPPVHPLSMCICLSINQFIHTSINLFIHSYPLALFRNILRYQKFKELIGCLATNQSTEIKNSKSLTVLLVHSIVL